MRACRVKGKDALFHRWSTKAWVIPPSPMMGGHTGGQMEIPVAIVEYKDGKVDEVYASDIRFVIEDDTTKGLYPKYDVFKADTEEKVFDCFVLRPGRDRAAFKALKTYAANTPNKKLAEDIYIWLAEMPLEV